jgi:hypothetical protein
VAGRGGPGGKDERHAVKDTERARRKARREEVAAMAGTAGAVCTRAKRGADAEAGAAAAAQAPLKQQRRAAVAAPSAPAPAAPARKLRSSGGEGADVGRGGDQQDPRRRGAGAAPAKGTGRKSFGVGGRVEAKGVKRGGRNAASGAAAVVAAR